jgi:hypothetical protein
MKRALVGLLDLGRTARLFRKSRARLRAVHVANPDLAGVALSAELRRGAAALWPERLARLDALAWSGAYVAISGVADHRYVGGYAFARSIRAAFNREELAPAYTDKGRLQAHFPGAPTPRVLLRIMHGRLYDAAYRPVSDPLGVLAEAGGGELVVKPSLESGGGKRVFIGRYADGAFHTERGAIAAAEFLADYGANAVVQEAIAQHEGLARFHAPSVNTLRIMTMRLAHEVTVLSTIVRFGVGGLRVDNEGAGGVSCGVTAAGALKAHAVDRLGRRFAAHPVTHVRFGGEPVPGRDAAHDLARSLHDTLQHFDLLSWDIAVTGNATPTLVEVNVLGQGLEFHQMNNGPLFGDETDAVLARVWPRRERDGLRRSAAESGRRTPPPGERPRRRRA